MSFSGQCWDFIRDHPQILNSEQKGLYALSIFDPFIERILLGRIPKAYWGDEDRKVLSGDELTIDWIRDNIETVDFFSSDNSYVVLRAEQISSKVSEYLLEHKLEWRNYFVLIFHGKSTLYDKLKKNKEVISYTVESPRFWEMGKLLQFLCQQMKISLPYDIQNYIVDCTPPRVNDYIQALKTVTRVAKEKGQMSLSVVRPYLTSHKYDQFHCAKLFGEKKFKSFYEEINEVNDFESYISLFRFLQGHLIKVSDPAYIKKKARASKYDKEIESQSHLWSKEDVKESLDDLAEMEILAKTKSQDLYTQMRLRLIKSYS